MLNSERHSNDWSTLEGIHVMTTLVGTRLKTDLRKHFSSLNPINKKDESVWVVNIKKLHGGKNWDWPTQISPKTGVHVKYSDDNLIDPGGVHPSWPQSGESLSFPSIIGMVKRGKDEGYKTLSIGLSGVTLTKKDKDSIDKIGKKSGMKIRYR